MARVWSLVAMGLLGGLGLALSTALPSSCGKSFALPPSELQSTSMSEAPANMDSFDVAPPPFSEGVFPCTDCHDPELPVRTKRREMKRAHQEIVLEHDAEHRWCLDCHDTADRDMLHLASGELVPFEESYRLCGQCHGDKYRDWRAGVHGRRSGLWNGEKAYQLCVHCHDAHSPRFKPMPPMPTPLKPRKTP